MIIDYTITDKMISLVVSISEKVARIKEIRYANKHIDFDLQCNDRNIYGVANRTDTHISYPKKRKSNLLKKDAIKYTDRDNNRFPKFEDIHAMYVKVRDYKAYSIKSFSKVYDSSLVKHADENDLNLIFKALSDQKYFFLYRIAEFCYNGYNYTCYDEIVQLTVWY